MEATPFPWTGLAAVAVTYPLFALLLGAPPIGGPPGPADKAVLLGGQAAAPAEERLALFDNVKFVSLVGVLAMHATDIVGMRVDRRSNDVWALTSIGHLSLQALTVVSGATSARTASWRNVRKSLHSLGLPLVSWIFIITPVGYAVFALVSKNGDPLQALTDRVRLAPRSLLNAADPQQAPWYLEALILWRMFALLCGLLGLTGRTLLAVSLVMHVMAAWLPPAMFFSADIAFAYLPSFALGMGIKDSGLALRWCSSFAAAALDTGWRRLAASAVLMVVLLCMPWKHLNDALPLYVAYNDSSRSRGCLSSIAGLIAVLALVALCVPTTGRWYTRYGAHSIYAYVLHFNLLLIVLPKGSLDFCECMWGCGFLVASLAVALTAALCTEPVRQAFGPLLGAGRQPWSASGCGRGVARQADGGCGAAQQSP